LSMGWLRDKLSRFDGKVSGVEVCVGLVSGDGTSPGEKSGVVRDVPAVGLTDDCS